MKLAIIILLLLNTNVHGFHIKPIKSKKFPKASYTKIHDISYKAPIRIRRMEPVAFTIAKHIGNFINNYINESYAMASFPLSYNFANLFNETSI